MNPAISYLTAAQQHTDAIRAARRHPFDVPARERREPRHGARRLLEAVAMRRLRPLLGL